MAFTPVTKATTLISAGWDAFNNLITDLLSTSNGKGASQIGVEDSAGNLSATNVEDAIAEIYADASTTITLAETFAENSSTTTGLTWGYKGGLFRLDNVVTDVSAGTIGLTDDATNYIEITAATGNTTKNTSAFTSGNIPIREVVTASGEQTLSTDSRAWFTQTVAESPATETSAGIIELSTDAEAITGTATDKVVTPANLKRVGVFYEPQRSRFIFKDIDEIYLDAAVYRHEGTTTQFCYWDSQLTYLFVSLGVSSWSYLYLDDSAIVTADTNVITSTEMIDNTTAPTWSNTKKGWYNGEDKCIFAVFTNGSSQLLEWNHANDFIGYDTAIFDLSDADIDTVWTDVILTAPALGDNLKIKTTVVGNYDTDLGDWVSWRKNGSSSTGNRIFRVTSTIPAPVNTIDVIGDTANTVEVIMDATGASKMTMYTNGWYFPIGM